MAHRSKFKRRLKRIQKLDIVVFALAAAAVLLLFAWGGLYWKERSESLVAASGNNVTELPVIMLDLDAPSNGAELAGGGNDGGEPGAAPEEGVEGATGNSGDPLDGLLDGLLDGVELEGLPTQPPADLSPPADSAALPDDDGQDASSGSGHQEGGGQQPSQSPSPDATDKPGSPAKPGQPDPTAQPGGAAQPNLTVPPVSTAKPDSPEKPGSANQPKPTESPSATPGASDPPLGQPGGDTSVDTEQQYEMRLLGVQVGCIQDAKSLLQGAENSAAAIDKSDIAAMQKLGAQLAQQLEAAHGACQSQFETVVAEAEQSGASKQRIEEWRQTFDDVMSKLNEEVESRVHNMLAQ